MSSSSSSSSSPLSLVLGTTVIVGTISSLGWWWYYEQYEDVEDHTKEAEAGRRNRLSPRHPRRRRRSTLSNIVENITTTTPSGGGGRSVPASSSSSSLAGLASTSPVLKPPFPHSVRTMLAKCRLAYLSTVDTEAVSSHLSLMRFTYVHDPVDGELVILSTKKKTKKFAMLQEQKGVALLVHDFGTGHNSTTNSSTTSATTTATTTNNNSTITLNGNCRILTGAEDIKYRAKHLHHNPDYPQFIVGDEIAVLCIDINYARICDLNDNVVHWNLHE